MGKKFMTALPPATYKELNNIIKKSGTMEAQRLLTSLEDDPSIISEKFYENISSVNKYCLLSIMSGAIKLQEKYKIGYSSKYANKIRGEIPTLIEQLLKIRASEGKDEFTTLLSKQEIEEIKELCRERLKSV
jgi:hypothetical protein